MLPSLGEVLAMEACRRGRPVVVAGADRLDTPVRWVHAMELTDVARLLRGGELVLSTGIALPDDERLLADYVTELADVGVAGLAVELGRRYAGSLPAALVVAAEQAGLPLIAFEHEVAFIEITEAVHARIIDAQLEELRVSERLHEMFTELSVAGASPEEVVRQAAALAGRPVILADLSHRVLAFSPGGADPGRLLSGFAARSRSVRTSGRTLYDEASGWLTTPVGARGEDWGRVILVCDGPPAPTDTVLIERAATTLALGRLLTRHRESLERQAHRTLISGIISQAHADPAEAAVRSRALGVPVDGRQLIALVLRFREPGLGVSAHARVLDLADTVAAACRAERIPSLVGTLDDARVGAMLSLGPRADVDDVLTKVATWIRDRAPAVLVGVGATAESIRDVRRSFLEASQVADVAASRPGDRDPLFYRLPDLRLRGLLHLLRDDPRLQTFVERELGALLAADPGLIDALAAYLAAGGNKAEAAKAAHLARPTFYERLRRIERICGTDLSSAESRTSLHVALLALNASQIDHLWSRHGCRATVSDPHPRVRRVAPGGITERQAGRARHRVRAEKWGHGRTGLDERVGCAPVRRRSRSDRRDTRGRQPVLPAHRIGGRVHHILTRVQRVDARCPQEPDRLDVAAPPAALQRTARALAVGLALDGWRKPGTVGPARPAGASWCPGLPRHVLAGPGP
jgi:PucR family transcriptional regulator, purine catabolism regulatory protein